MREPKAAPARPYHHGDLRRALIVAAQRLLATEGAAALSLRAVAREAGVSAAAPYHHFKDKSELLSAVAEEGWRMLTQALAEASQAATVDDGLKLALLAYVCFARDEPALYRLMYDTARSGEMLPMVAHEGEETPFARVRAALSQKGANPSDLDVEVAVVGAWCAAHGLAEMAGFKQFEHLKAQLGGELPFLAAVLEGMGLYRPLPTG